MKNEKVRIVGHITHEEKEVLREHGKTHEAGMSGIVSDLVIAYLTSDEPKHVSDTIAKLNDAAGRLKSYEEFCKEIGTKVNTIELFGGTSFFAHTLLRIDALNETSKKIDSLYDNKLQQDTTLNEQAETIKGLEAST